MISFDVNDMSCGHCVNAITMALKAVDRNATIDIDLASHRVTIEPTEADGQQLRAAIEDAGYTPVPVTTAAPATAASKTRSAC